MRRHKKQIDGCCFGAKVEPEDEYKISQETNEEEEQSIISSLTPLSEFGKEFEKPGWEGEKKVTWKPGDFRLGLSPRTGKPQLYRMQKDSSWKDQEEDFKCCHGQIVVFNKSWTKEMQDMYAHNPKLAELKHPSHDPTEITPDTCNKKNIFKDFDQMPHEMGYKNCPTGWPNLGDDIPKHGNFTFDDGTIPTTSVCCGLFKQDDEKGAMGISGD